MGFVDLDSVKVYLELSNPEGDERLDVIIDSACKTIESYCGRTFSSNNYIEYFDGGRSSIFINNIPINSINLISEYDGAEYIPLVSPNPDGTQINTKANSNTAQFMWYSDTGEISRDASVGSGFLEINITKPKVFRNYPKGVRVEYNGGFDTIPADLKLATYDYIKSIWKGIDSEMVSFQGETIRAFPNSANFPPHIRRILSLYRIIL